MLENDSVRLLRECDAGAKMAVASFEEVINRTKDGNLRLLLNESRKFHEEIGDEIHTTLLQWGSTEKSPNPIAKGMSWVKTNTAMAVNHDDSVIADLMTDGCNMGVKSLNRYLNQYRSADESTKDICKKLIRNEQTLTTEIAIYL